MRISMNPSPAKQGARRDNYYSSFAQTSQDPEEEADILESLLSILRLSQNVSFFTIIMMFHV